MKEINRQWLFELLVFWEGKASTKSLCEQFKISRQQASADIKRYIAQRPENIRYCKRAKRYLPKPTFTPKHISGQAQEYLDWLVSGRLPWELPQAFVHQVRLSKRHISPFVIRGLVQAIKNQQRIEVDYQSLSQPNREGRIIAPHSIIDAGMRWHVRAWCEKHQQYRDFVLSRFHGEPELLGEAKQQQADMAWNTEIELVLQADPRLSQTEQQVIAHDYQMDKGQLRLSTRASVASYLLQQLQVSVKILDGNPKAQQLVLVNLDDIKPWLIS